MAETSLGRDEVPGQTVEAPAAPAASGSADDDAFNELRSLIVGPERRDLRALEAHVNDAALRTRVEAAKAELLAAPALAALLDDAAGALTRALRADLAGPHSEVATWLVDRLDRARLTLVGDSAVRREIETWVKAQVGALVEHHHARIAAFIENGVRALGPEGAVRLIEEHAGDDLQYIRVNGTVVGGLAGGAIYGLHLLLRWL